MNSRYRTKIASAFNSAAKRRHRQSCVSSYSNLSAPTLVAWQGKSGPSALGKPATIHRLG